MQEVSPQVDRQTKGTDKILKGSNSAGLLIFILRDYISSFCHCKREKQKYKELINNGEQLLVENISESDTESVKKTMLMDTASC